MISGRCQLPQKRREEWHMCHSATPNWPSFYRTWKIVDLIGFLSNGCFRPEKLLFLIHICFRWFWMFVASTLKTGRSWRLRSVPHRGLCHLATHQARNGTMLWFFRVNCANEKMHCLNFEDLLNWQRNSVLSFAPLRSQGGFEWHPALFATRLFFEHAWICCKDTTENSFWQSLQILGYVFSQIVTGCMFPVDVIGPLLTSETQAVQPETDGHCFASLVCGWVGPEPLAFFVLFQGEHMFQLKLIPNWSKLWADQIKSFLFQ